MELFYEIYSIGKLDSNYKDSTMNFHGETVAKTFNEACKKLFTKDIGYDARAKTYWGMPLYCRTAEYPHGSYIES